MVGIGLPVREVARHGSIARTLDQCRVKHGGSSTRLSEAYCSGGTRGRTRTGTAVKPEDFKSSMSTIPSRGHSGEHRQNAGRVKADSLQIRAQIRDQIPICGERV